MAFFLGRDLVVIDSMQFINSSLDKLVTNLVDKDFKYLVEEFGTENLKILKQKGTCPYEYMNSFKKFNEDKLCARKYFYSSTKNKKISDDGKISDGHISIEDYMVCEKFCDKFKMKNMGNYHDHYLKKDVLLLADVFERFIGTYWKYYGLDPCHYFSSPGLSWDAMLKMTGVKLKTSSDIDIYLFIEKGLRGGISYITKRYAKANNKCIKNHDPTEPSIYISYLDMNNLHGWTMSDYLPYGRFKWLKNVDKFDVNSVSKINPVGYILKVDLEYPDELHVLHNDYPLAPGKLVIPYEMLSDCMKNVVHNKANYVLHYRYLQF